ncbi:leishmanolysin-related zinc metalloendopeptidase [uncultured Desulfobacter sp.]|uniref:leishmanolysin-related zinc metalloendopeptidase n=1 Tax=uncultured Desulfobacter sp. TaxID=240139 RepID=UPI002AABDAD2|nr:leishmanolysin-related zinc metalloendopeptidase [uncultured Desulfobacter sp.]
MFRKFWRVFFISLFLMISSAPFVYATPFDIKFTLTDFTTEQESVFARAENYWESVISGYQAGIDIDSLNISAAMVELDGKGGTLGNGGPNLVIEQGGYFLATSGIINLDSDDYGTSSNWEFYDTVVHEIAHVIGFGTLWGSEKFPDNEVYDYKGEEENGTFRYTGAAALAAYRAEYDPDATYVPVENDGGPGTAGAHWEKDFFGDEMMTGWSLPQPAFVSRTTLASFVDIGYVLAEQNPVPEPATVFLFGLGLIGLSGLNRRKS